MNRLAVMLQVASISIFWGFNAQAGGFENGDFSHGKSKWVGEARMVSMKPDGTFEEIQPTAVSSSLNVESGTSGASKPSQFAEIKLATTMFKSLSQNFMTGKGSGVLNVEVIYKGSPDFKLNDKALVFSRDFTWQAGSIWYWSSMVSPKVDLCLRLDKNDGHCYKLERVKSGGDWQKTKFRWDNVGENRSVTFCIVAPPGHGSLFVKSVAISE